MFIGNYEQNSSVRLVKSLTNSRTSKCVFLQHSIVIIFRVFFSEKYRPEKLIPDNLLVAYTS